MRPARIPTALIRPLLLVLILTVFAVGLAGCGVSRTGKRVPPAPPARPPAAKPAPSKAPALSGQSYVINGQRYWVLASAHQYAETGVASWYGREFHGRKTSNGETYDMYALTAAHKTLPLGTWVRVTRLSNRASIVVRINDRGPFVAGRIVDLSYTGAKKLGLVGPGTGTVRVEALGQAEDMSVDGRVRHVFVQPPSYEEGLFIVQVGAFLEEANARALAARLRTRYALVFVEPFDNRGRLFHRVRVSEEKTLGDARRLQDRLEREGFKDCFVVAR